VLAIDIGIPHAIGQRLKEEYAAISSLVPDSKAFCAVTKHVGFNNRLRTSAGRAVQDKQNRYHWHIELNPKYYRVFGLERMIGTYRHELAHVAAWVSYREPGHTRNFKRLCELFGGTMNPGQAGHGASPNATTEYLTTSPKWRYICPSCGLTFSRQRRLSPNMIRQACCAKCHTSARKMQLEQLR
jgi:predicted SprT family Zn-dependent metalloprotease